MHNTELRTLLRLYEVLQLREMAAKQTVKYAKLDYRSMKSPSDCIDVYSSIADSKFYSVKSFRSYRISETSTKTGAEGTARLNVNTTKDAEEDLCPIQRTR